MERRSKWWISLVAVCLAAGLLSGCTARDVAVLSDNALRGRDNGTPGSAIARGYLIDQLKPIATGLNSSASGDAAYTQSLAGGTNVVAVIPGTDLADEYVVVGAHYDHLGDTCANTLVPRRHDLQRRDRQRRRGRGGARRRARDRRSADQAATVRGHRSLGRGGGRAARLALLRPAPARAARQDGRLRQLRHPGLQRAAEPEQHELRRSIRDRRDPAPGHRAERRSESSRSTPRCSARSSARGAATTSTSSLRTCRPSSSPTPPGPATTRSTTRSAWWTSTSWTGRSRLRWP